MGLFGTTNRERAPHAWRADFPMLADGKLTYFDNACQSLRPQQVIDAITEYYVSYSVCAGRSIYRAAEMLDERLKDARAELARFINAQPREIIFTRNTTEGINLVARSLGLRASDAVVISDKEHNSNLVPWLELKKRTGIELRVVSVRTDNTFDLAAFDEALARGGVKLVALSLVSNLDGVSIPEQEVIGRAHRAGALVLFDAAQAAPHRKIDATHGADFIAFSGHKMLGPSGTGILYGKYEHLEKLGPFLVGGDTVESTTFSSAVFLPPPEKFEAGLQDYAGMLGLAAAARYIGRVGFDAIAETEHALNERITAGIRDIPGLAILGPDSPAQRSGIISCTVGKCDPHAIAIMLSKTAGIAVRSGEHCAHAWFAKRGIPAGTVRASVYFYNTPEEADRFIAALHKIMSVL